MSKLRVDTVTKKHKDSLTAIHIKNRFDLYNASKYLKKENLNVPINSWIVVHGDVIEILDEIEFDDKYNLVFSTFLEFKSIDH